MLFKVADFVECDDDGKKRLFNYSSFGHSQAPSSYSINTIIGSVQNVDLYSCNNGVLVFAATSGAVLFATLSIHTLSLYIYLLIRGGYSDMINMVGRKYCFYCCRSIYMVLTAFLRISGQCFNFVGNSLMFSIRTFSGTSLVLL